MTKYAICDPYAWENPKVLLSTGFTVRQRKSGPCASEFVNSVVLIYLLCFVAATISTVTLQTKFAVPFFMGLATIMSLPHFMALREIQKEVEGFADAEPSDQSSASVPACKTHYKDTTEDLNATEVYDVIGMGAAPATLTLPSARNPFMNVLIDEIKYNPTRPMAATVMDPSVKVTLDDFFRTEFYSDPTDVFGKTQGQRQFVAMPSTSIPNDVDSYQKWLYKIPGKTCKEGGREACLPGTDGGALPWMNN
jgi:hypothetical protein